MVRFMGHPVMQPPTFSSPGPEAEDMGFADLPEARRTNRIYQEYFIWLCFINKNYTGLMEAGIHILQSCRA